MTEPRHHHEDYHNGGEVTLARVAPYGATPMIIRAMLNRCAKETGIPVQDIIGPRKTADCVYSRHATMWAAREVMSKRRRGSFPAIGRVFHRDHSTVMYAVKKATILRTTDEDFRRLTDALIADLTPAESHQHGL